MINTKLTRKAMILAYDAHMGQYDRAEVPYIYHPIHLAEQMDNELECIVALLHDVVEDTMVTFDDLEKDFSKEVIDVLRLLTHDKKVEYMEYIKKIKNNPIAKKIKIADIRHNMDETRLDVINSKDIKRKEKYVKALKILEDGENNETVNICNK